MKRTKNIAYKSGNLFDGDEHNSMALNYSDLTENKSHFYRYVPLELDLTRLYLLSEWMTLRWDLREGSAMIIHNYFLVFRNE